MGLTKEHYHLIRKHFYDIFGKKCCNENCNETDIKIMHFHHISGNAHILNGKSGRGGSVQIWELFRAYEKNDLKMLCKNCHIDTDNYGGRNQ